VSSAADTAAATPGSPGTVIRDLPPIATLALVSMVLVIVGTIYFAATIGREQHLWIPLALQAVAIVLFAAACVLTIRIESFARRTFFVVAKWALLGYVVIGGMIEFVFIKNDTPAKQLATLTIGLAIFVLDVTLILAFGVARYQPAD
jgi:hypothetical protein